MTTKALSINWHWIKFETSDTWAVVLRKLQNAGIKNTQLSRCVYSIRISAKFAIKYPNGVSPTLYIGEGHLHQRIDSHRKWLAKLEKVFGEVKLEVAVAMPRVQNNSLAYKETEAALIQFFLKKYGSAPFKNSHIEYQRFGHVFVRSDLAVALTPGRGTRYHWAIEPTKINPFYKIYAHTHQG
jgi:hypothetical protein